jgi:hypothetical protein
MPSVAALASRSLTLLVLGFIAVTLWKIFTQSISLSGLLCDAQGNFSPGRAQMLMVSLLVALQYLGQVMHKPTAFPEIPSFWLAALGASQGIYLGGKAQDILFGNRSNQS